MEKKIFCGKIRKYVPIVPLFLFAFSIISLGFYIAFRSSASFADTFNYSICVPFRFLITKLTVLLPFSLAEVLIISSPIWLALLIYLAVRFAKQGKAPTIRYASSLLGILCFLFISFVWTYSSGYYTTTIDQKIGIERTDLTADDLYNASVVVIEQLNDLSKNIVYDETGASVMPYSYTELSEKLSSAYETFEKEYSVCKTFSSRIKPIVLSEPMTYTHISGVYSFMTGEVNINVNYPDFIVASTSAHEMAHQRGIAREEEANFVALLVCISSEDDFIRYSGYLDIYGYLMNALYGADKELYRQALRQIDTNVLYDRISYSNFFDKYRDSKASEVSEKINSSYLQGNGQSAGARSYDFVTDLACAYFNSLEK